MLTWLSDNGWLAWLALALGLGAFEAASVDFVFLMLAGGALAGSGAAAAGLPFTLQVVLAIVVAALLLFGVRPVVRRHFLATIGVHKIGRSEDIGRTALVIKTVTELDGRVRLSGETWSARVAQGSPQCLPGQEVRVVSIEGATAIVSQTADGRESESNHE